MQAISRWLAASPSRPTIINLLMLSAVLAMVGSPELYAAIGGALVLCCGVAFLRRAARLSFARGADHNALQLALIWIPGGLALALTLLALDLVTSPQASMPIYGLGAVLFAAEISLLAAAGYDLARAQRHSPGKAAA